MPIRTDRSKGKSLPLTEERRNEKLGEKRARRLWDPVLLILLAAVAVAVMTFSALPQLDGSAQTSGTTVAQAPAPKPDPPGTIDGKKNPELIPDEVAYKMFFLAVAEPENPTPEQLRRARAKIAAAGLGEQDTEAFLTLLGQFHKVNADIKAQNAVIHERNPFPHQISSDWKEAVELDKRRRQNVADTIAALPARLTPEGLAKLQAHLQEVKRGIKRIPWPDMPGMPKE
jgi:hypothetical protein